LKHIEPFELNVAVGPIYGSHPIGLLYFSLDLGPQSPSNAEKYNSLLISSLFSHFIENKYLHGNMGTYKIGELPWHNTLGFFCWGR